jgi:hypothetical protein
MMRNKKSRLGPVVVGLLAVAAGAAACTDTFTAEDCAVTHTCEPSAAAGAAAGDPDAAAAGAGGNGPATCGYESCDCEEGETRACGPEAEVGICKPGTQACSEGAWGECKDAVEAQDRDCTSPLDNDCDGSPDNVIDESCRCEPGTTEACGEHPGLDGNGPCQAGERSCMGSGASGVWGPCVGSVGPKATDQCDVKGDDSDCDGEANGGCTCIAGDESSCGDVYAATHGECVSISLTCTSEGKWPSSSACSTTQPEVCDSSFKDENCNGVVDEYCDCPESTNLPPRDAALIGTCCRKATEVGYLAINLSLQSTMACRFTDLAAGKAATSDSEAPGFPASNATDSSLTTLWKAADTAAGHWLEIDLGEKLDVRGVMFKVESPGAYEYKLEISSTRAVWISRGTGTLADTATWHDVPFPSVAMRYIRITLTGLPAGKSAALGSVRVYR